MDWPSNQELQKVRKQGNCRRLAFVLLEVPAIVFQPRVKRVDHSKDQVGLDLSRDHNCLLRSLKESHVFSCCRELFIIFYVTGFGHQ